MTIMKSVNVALVLLLVFCASPQKPAQSAKQSRGPWKLVWSDEFDYNGLPDEKKWDYDVGGHGWGNKELQFYTARRKENARVEDGHLIVEARKESWEGRDYTSGRLVSRGKGDWTYGPAWPPQWLPCRRSRASRRPPAPGPAHSPRRTRHPRAARRSPAPAARSRSAALRSAAPMAARLGCDRGACACT